MTNYTRYQLQTPIVACEALSVFPESEHSRFMEDVWYAFTLCLPWDSFKSKLTLKSLLLK